MTTTDDRADRIRKALDYLIRKGELRHGDLTRLAQHFGVTRERVRQLKDEVENDYQRSLLGVRPVSRMLADATPLGVVRRS